MVGKCVRCTFANWLEKKKEKRKTNKVSIFILQRSIFSFSAFVIESSNKSHVRRCTNVIERKDEQNEKSLKTEKHPQIRREKRMNERNNTLMENMRKNKPCDLHDSIYLLH